MSRFNFREFYSLKSFSIASIVKPVKHALFYNRRKSEIFYTTSADFKIIVFMPLLKKRVVIKGNI
jgi:hypothetical protein